MERYYSGGTNNLESRIHRHNFGKGSQWVKQHGKGAVAYLERYRTLVEARKREAQVKKWSRKKKENLILEFRP